MSCRPTLSLSWLISVTIRVLRHRIGGDPTIAQNAHGDPMPPGDGWSSDPYGGARCGSLERDLATYAFALRALKPLCRP